MKIYVNNVGQVTEIKQSHLVANASLGLTIDVIINGVTETQKRQMKFGFLSVIREDGFEITDILMERSIADNVLKFSYQLQDASQILAVPGNLQISAQIKALKEEYEGATADELANLENYYTFSSVSVVGFVQKNIGSQREITYAEKVISNKVIPIAHSVSELQHDFADLQDEFEQVKEEFKDVKQGSVDDALSATSTLPVQNKVLYFALNQKADKTELANKQDRLFAGDGIIINGNVISSTGGSGGSGQSITIDGELSATSTNPVQNKVITAAINAKASNEAVNILSGEVSKKANLSDLETKQNKLSEGDGILIMGDTVSAQGVFRGSVSINETYEINDIVFWLGGAKTPRGFRYVTNRLGAGWSASALTVDEIMSTSTLPFGGVSGVETSYIDLYLFLNNKEGLKTAIQAAYDARPIGAERANIVFYNSSARNEDQFIFPANSNLFISSCNYSFIDTNYYQTRNQLYLSGLKNCDFYGVNAGAVADSAVLFVENCENLQFTNCYFGNDQSHAIEIKNSTDIYFENTEIQSGNFAKYTFVKVVNTNSAYNNITFDSCLFKQPSTLLPTAIDATGTTNTKAVVLLSTCLFSDGVPVYGENIKKGAAQVVLSPTETREKYIDVSEFIIGGASDYTRFNARLKELASQAKGGQDRAEIFFYQTNKTYEFVFDSNVAWQSNCNYHNLLASYTETSGTATGKPVVFDGIENCDFYGFNFSQYSAQACVRILASCSNLYFERCSFSATYAYVCECYGKNLRFDGCTFAFLSNIGDSLVCIENKASDLSVCIFENCKFVMSHVTTAHHALGDFSTNAKSLIMVLHCYEDDLSEIGASKIKKGNSKSTIRVSALQTI